MIFALGATILFIVILNKICDKKDILEQELEELEKDYNELYYNSLNHSNSNEEEPVEETKSVFQGNINLY